ncbi:MAG: DUF262 domain-containing protein [Crocinitomicaceae bacterium]
MQESTIVIPIIQRDYAQGRQTEIVKKIRNKFLKALFSAIKNEEELLLDFVYGYHTKRKKKGRKEFIPLDGQQRLTTLFLLHWVVAVKEGNLEEANEYLARFTYEVRHSSKEFCKKLVEFKPSNEDFSLSENITNQPWYYTEWKYDPTISGMLVTISEIEKLYTELNKREVWTLLVGENSCLKFYCLPMEKLGLTDSLYIKMNSRGKPLTKFEIFKSNFSGYLSDGHKKIFNDKIDSEWSDMFWTIFLNDSSKDDIAMRMDDGILRFLEFITDILMHVNSINYIANEDALDRFKRVYYNNEDNVIWLFSLLDKLKEKDDFSSFFSNLFYKNTKNFQPSKSRLFFRNPSVNLLLNCMKSYKLDLQKSAFTFGERLLLYALIIHELEETTDFENRLRILRNLVANSEDEMRMENYREFLASTRDLIVNGMSAVTDSPFNARQKLEEERKQSFLIQNISMIDTVRRLEDHSILRGNLSSF